MSRPLHSARGSWSDSYSVSYLELQSLFWLLPFSLPSLDLLTLKQNQRAIKPTKHTSKTSSLDSSAYSQPNRYHSVSFLSLKARLLERIVHTYWRYLLNLPLLRHCIFSYDTTETISSVVLLNSKSSDVLPVFIPFDVSVTSDMVDHLE